MTDPAPEFIPVTLDVPALEDFRRPFAPEAIRWKIQSTWKNGGGATLISYIDARLVIERLNHVTALWEDEYRMLGENRAECSLTVCGVTRRDVGVGQGVTPDVMLKATYSDALKRAAVKFGIGVSLYALPSIMLRVGEKDSELRERNGKPVVDDRTVARLRAGYAKWLKERGEEMFGPALDHGDAAGAVGDPDVQDVPSEEPSGASDGLPVGMGPAMEAAVKDAQDAWGKAWIRWTGLADSEKNELAERVGYPCPMPGVFARDLRAAVEVSDEDNLEAVFGLTARLEKLA